MRALSRSQHQRCALRCAAQRRGTTQSTTAEHNVCKDLPSACKTTRLTMRPRAASASWADCMEHYMQSGLSYSLVALPSSGGTAAAAAEDAGLQSPGAGGCVVKIVLKNTIKFPIADAVLVLTSSRPPADDAGTHTTYGGKQPERPSAPDLFRVMQQM